MSNSTVVETEILTADVIPIEKIEPVVEIKESSQSTSESGGSIKEVIGDSSTTPPAQPKIAEESAEDSSNNVSDLPAGDETLGKKPEDKPAGDDEAAGAATLISQNWYDKLQKRMQYMEKKLSKECGITFKDEDTYTDSGSETSTDDSDEEVVVEKVVEKPEPPFSLKDHVKYILSDGWCNTKSRALWESTTSQHTLVVSMKSRGANALHESLNPDPTPAEDVKDTEELDNDMANLEIDRVAIVSETLLTEIGRISSTTLLPSANVFVQPFKVLVPFRDQFAECQEENQVILDKLLAEKVETESSKPEVTPEALIEGTKVKKVEDDKKKDDKKEGEKDNKEEKWSSEKQTQLKKAEKIVNGMKCILYFLDKNLHNAIEVRRQIKEGTLKEIAFEHIWHLFSPGDLVVSRKLKDQAYRVLHVGGGRKARDETDEHGKAILNSRQGGISDFFLDCFYIDFNGINYGAAPMKITISPYEGLRQITALEILPICFLPEAEKTGLETLLLERGKKFVKLARVSHVKYRGLSLKENNFRHEEVDGDAIIDFALAFRNSKPPYEIEPPAFGGGVLEEPTKSDINETKEVLQGCSTYGHCETIYVYNDSEFDLARRTEFINASASSLGVVPADEGKLGRERQMLLPPRVYGYVLLSRKWYPLDINLVEEVKEPQVDVPDGFTDLVLPKDHKQIVRALVKTHTRGPRSTSNNKGDLLPSRDIDLVKGKGKGLIILLHGVPGVGKTSTAECVAANTNRPLFPITCGDIGGTTAKEVEDNLESYFDLARKWGCVLLLDEADVFLGERTKGDIVQNSLVSVFLRVLEYYSGILILTTNRVGQFDEAIKSRVHISLYYPPLTKKTSLEIWKMNLNRLEREEKGRSTKRPIIFSRKDIMEFANAHWADNEISNTNWNGRQIKNAFQTAIALAEFEYMELQSKLKTNDGGPLLEASHFKKVATASARFDRYLISVRSTDAKNSEIKFNRKDDFIDNGIPTESGLRYPSLKDAQKAKRAERAKPKPTSPSDTDSDESDGTIDSMSDVTDEEFVRKKQEIDRLKSKKEQQQKQKEEAEKNAKKKKKDMKKQQELEKKRQELLKRREMEMEEEEDDDDNISE